MDAAVVLSTLPAVCLKRSRPTPELETTTATTILHPKRASFHGHPASACIRRSSNRYNECQFNLHPLDGPLDVLGDEVPHLHRTLLLASRRRCVGERFDIPLSRHPGPG